jgi:putative Mg2+ transporter-C (MgtC) family protein
MPSQLELILRLLLAGALAGTLGAERELTEQPAGIRTHILVGVGSALFAIVSAYGFQAIAGQTPNSAVRVDVTRIASQIVVGIGFLGGGAILKYGASVRGLTTAASLWVTAAIGLTAAIGMLAIASATAGITLVALVGLRPLRRVLRRYSAGRDEFTIVAGPDLDLEELVAMVRGKQVRILELKVADEGGVRTVHLVVRATRETQPADLVAVLERAPDVRHVEWSG